MSPTSAEKICHEETLLCNSHLKEFYMCFRYHFEITLQHYFELVGDRLATCCNMPKFTVICELCLEYLLKLLIAKMSLPVYGQCKSIFYIVTSVSI